MKCLLIHNIFTLLLRRTILVLFFFVCLGIIHTKIYSAQRTDTFERRPSATVMPFLLKGQDQEKQKNYLLAMKFYTQATVADPRDPFAYALRGILDVGYFHNWERAILDLTTTIRLWDKFPRVYFYRGICRLNTQDLRGAIEDFRRAAKINAKDMEVYLNWGRSYQFLLDYDKSEDVLSEGLKYFPNAPLLYQERGIIRLKKNRYQEAIRDFTSTLALLPNEEIARTNRAYSYRVIGRFSEAIDDLTYLIKNGQNSTLTFYNRACVFLAMGEYAQSIDDAKRTLQIDSTYHPARLVMAQAYHKLGQLDRSLDVSSALLRYNPQENAAFSNVLGLVNAADKSQYCIATEAYLTRSNTRLSLGDTLGALADIDKAYMFEGEEKKISDAELKFSLEARAHFQRQQIILPAENFPASLQLFPRNNRDSAVVNLEAQIQRVGNQEYDSVYVDVLKNNVPQKRYAVPLFYEGSAAKMNLQIGIHAECSFYAFNVGLKVRDRNFGTTSIRDTIVLRRDSIVCGDAFLVAGQSNIVLGTLPPTPHNNYIRTFSSGVRDSYWGLASANNNVDDYNIGACVLQMAEEYVAARKIPVAIIHSGLSGSVIELHLPKDDITNRMINRTWYAHTLRYAKKSGLEKAFLAALWYHGEANTDQDYFGKFATLLHYWQQDYPSLRKIYSVQIRPARCGQVGQASLREQQRRFKEISPVISLHASAGVQGFDNCHYSNVGYSDLGKQLARLLARDFYAAADTVGIASPMLLRAAWTGADHKEIILEFDTNDSLVISPDIQVSRTLQTLAQSAFLLDGKQTPALSVRTTSSQVFVTFANAVTAQTISYIPDKFYTTAPDDVYSGPWLLTRRGVGALTFHNVPIQTSR